MPAKTYRPSRPRYDQKPVKSYRPARLPAKPIRRRSSKIAGGCLWLAVLVIINVGLYWLVQRFFVVRQVGCIINRSTTGCSASLWATAEKLQGQPMLFADFPRILQEAYSDRTAFDYVTYYKLLPDKVVVDYHFPEPIYQLSLGDDIWMGFALDGRYTIATSEASLVQISSFYPELNERLVNFQVDDLLHQKFLELDFYSRYHRDNWQAVTLTSLNELRIETDNSVYIVDPFDLDRNLQKLFYVEKNRRSDKKQEIDLRLNVPVVRDLAN